MSKTIEELDVVTITGTVVNKRGPVLTVELVNEDAGGYTIEVHESHAALCEARPDFLGDKEPVTNYCPVCQAREDWVSVEDRLPEIGKSALLWNGLNVHAGCLDKDGQFMDAMGGKGFLPIKAWRLLPSPPETT